MNYICLWRHNKYLLSTFYNTVTNIGIKDWYDICKNLNIKYKIVTIEHDVYYLSFFSLIEECYLISEEDACMIKLYYGQDVAICKANQVKILSKWALWICKLKQSYIQKKQWWFSNQYDIVSKKNQQKTKCRNRNYPQCR